MKTAFLLACVALGFAGCSTNSGGVGPAAETTEGRAYGWENDVQAKDPRGSWENWRYGGTPSRISPRAPMKTAAPPPAAAPSVPAASSGAVGVGVESTTTPTYLYYYNNNTPEAVEPEEPHNPSSFWDSARFGGGPDQITPRIPLDPVFSPAPVSTR